MVNLLKNRLFQILTLATIVRLFLLESVPVSLNWDEVSQGYTAYSVAQTGRDEWGEKLPVFFRSYGEWKSAVYIYLLVPLIKIFGASTFIIRLPSAIAGIISVYLIYLICKRLYSESIGLWAAFLMAVTPWSLFLSRPAFEANVALTLILAGIYLFLNNSFLLSGILFGLAPHTYNSAKIVVPIIVIYLIWSSKLYKNLKSSLLLLITLAVFALPILLNLFSGRSLARFTQVGITTDQESLERFYALRKSIPIAGPVDKIIINKVSFFAYKFTDNYLAYLSPAFLAWHGGSHTQQSLPYHGVLYVAEFILMIVGLLALLRSGSVSKGLPIMLILVGIIPAAMTRDPEHVLRSILAIPGFIILAAYGMEYLSSKRTKSFHILSGLLVLEIVCYIFFYFTWYAPAYARDWQYGYPQVSAYIERHADEYDQIVVTKWFGEPQLFLAFYGKWDPIWYQQENIKNIEYEQKGKMWLDQLDSYSLGKYTFRYINWQEEKRDKKTLYIGKKDDFYADSNIKETIKYPDGTVAFYIVEGDK